MTIERNTNDPLSMIEALDFITEQIGSITLDKMVGKHRITFKIEECDE